MNDRSTIDNPRRVAVVGGGGHVGFPLGLILCKAGHHVTLVDRDKAVLAAIRSGVMPYREAGADGILQDCLKSGRLQMCERFADAGEQDIVIVTIGTPVDEYLNPAVRVFERVVHEVLDDMRDGQVLIVRSTVFPGATERLAGQVRQRGLDVDVAYCPERIAQGYAIEEFARFPQLVSGVTERAERRAAEFFRELDCETISLTPLEAELGKLFTNSYRYINFAISNQFYMLASHFGADFLKIHGAVTKDYPRLKDFAKSGFVGGPCLLKDTMQLASNNHNLLALGQHAMMVNEALPRFLVDQVKKTRDLSTATAGILGMTFKGDCDDSRSSLSFKLRKILTLECPRVLCTDPYLDDEEFVSLETVLQEADVVFLGACHREYRNLKIDQELVDVFGFINQGS